MAENNEQHNDPDGLIQKIRLHDAMREAWAETRETAVSLTAKLHATAETLYAAGVKADTAIEPTYVAPAPLQVEAELMHTEAKPPRASEAAEGLPHTSPAPLRVEAELLHTEAKPPCASEAAEGLPHTSPAPPLVEAELLHAEAKPPRASDKPLHLTVRKWYNKAEPMHAEVETEQRATEPLRIKDIPLHVAVRRFFAATGSPHAAAGLPHAAAEPTHTAAGPLLATDELAHTVAGQPHTEAELLRNAAGILLATDERAHAAAGQPHAEAGQPHTEAEPPRNAAGTLLATDELAHAAAGQPHAEAGLPHAETEPTRNADGTLLATDELAHAAAGQAYAAAGPPHTEAGQPHTEAGQPRAAAGQPHAEAEQLHAEAGLPRAADEPSHAEAGQLHAEAELPRNAAGPLLATDERAHAGAGPPHAETEQQRATAELPYAAPGSPFTEARPNENFYFEDEESMKAKFDAIFGALPEETDEAVASGWPEDPETPVFELPPLTRLRKKPRDKKGDNTKKIELWKILLAILICMLFAMGSYLVGKVYGATIIPDEPALILPTENEPIPDSPQEEVKSPQILTALLMGTDQRLKNEMARSDTIILIAANLDTLDVHMVSIPRDTRTRIAGSNEMKKINHAHAVGGPELLVKTVEELLGIKIHYYAETNFLGFAKCVDILGGVRYNVERRMYFPEEGIDLMPGEQKLNGDKALQYVRWRGDPTADIGRVARQQKFIKALLDQSMSLATLPKLPGLISAIRENVVTDMTATQMLNLATRFVDLSSLRFSSDTLPGEAKTIGGGAYWVLDEDAVHGLLEGIFNPPEPEPEQEPEPDHELEPEPDFEPEP